MEELSYIQSISTLSLKNQRPNQMFQNRCYLKFAMMRTYSCKALMFFHSWVASSLRDSSSEQIPLQLSSAAARKIEIKQDFFNKPLVTLPFNTSLFLQEKMCSRRPNTALEATNTRERSRTILCIEDVKN